MASSLPYVNAYGTIGKALKKIISAAAPERFTQDFLATKLGLKGGSPKPVIPFLKRIGFLGSDGIPTELYKQFRNPTSAKIAAKIALKKGYEPLYEMNEYVHDLSDGDLKGLVVQATGLGPTSPAVRGIVGSFKALKEFASFEGSEEVIEESVGQKDEAEVVVNSSTKHAKSAKMNLSYTINLNLPATSDIAVFNAIFKSLREHLLKE